MKSYMLATMTKLLVQKSFSLAFIVHLTASFSRKNDVFLPKMSHHTKPAIPPSLPPPEEDLLHLRSFFLNHLQDKQLCDVTGMEELIVKNGTGIGWWARRCSSMSSKLPPRRPGFPPGYPSRYPGRGVKKPKKHDLPRSSQSKLNTLLKRAKCQPTRQVIHLSEEMSVSNSGRNSGKNSGNSNKNSDKSNKNSDKYDNSDKNSGKSGKSEKKTGKSGNSDNTSNKNSDRYSGNSGIYDSDSDFDSDSGVSYIPCLVHVKRCVGCCNSDILECAPTVVRNKTFTVMKLKHEKVLKKTDNRSRYSLPKGSNLVHRIKVLEHRECECQCKETASDCSPAQEFEPRVCKCVCPKATVKHCTTGKGWSDRLCSCVCSEERDCTTGMKFSQETCRCEVNHSVEYFDYLISNKGGVEGDYRITEERKKIKKKNYT